MVALVEGSWNVLCTIDATRPAPTWLLDMSGHRSIEAPSKGFGWLEIKVGNLVFLFGDAGLEQQPRRGLVL